MVRFPGYRFLSGVSIRKKLFFLRIGVGLGIGLIIATVSVGVATHVLYSLMERNLKASVRLVSGQVHQAILAVGHDAGEVAQSPEMEKYFHSGRSLVLSNLFTKFAGDFQQMVCLDYQGMVKFAMVNGKIREATIPWPWNLSTGFEQSVKSPNTLVVDGVVSDTVLEQPVIRYYYNQIDFFDNQMGVVAASVSLEALAPKIAAIFSGVDATLVMVTDAQGRVVFGPRKEDFGKPGPDWIATVDPPEAGAYVGKYPVYGSLSLVAARTVPELGWKTFVIKPASIIDQPLYLLFGLVLGAALFALGCGEFLSRALGIRILEPIDRLTRVVADILESGNLTQRVEWTSGDEMGKLAGLFNSMLAKIDTEQIELQEQRNRELEQEVAKRKKDQARLREAIVETQAATRAKSEFLANMSHEIRTPMNGIIGMTELALSSRMEPGQKHLIRAIATEAESLLAIINEILDFSKIEAGKLELEALPFNLRTLFEDLANTFAVTAGKKGLDFIAYLPSALPETLIGDSGRLRQILVNLVGNAIKFTHAGQIHIWVEPVPADGDQVGLRFHIQDSGIGIEPSRQGIIFDSFVQADGSTTRKYGGTGLGTTIAKQLVEMMGGTIGFDSKSGQGTRFWFTVMLGKDPDASAQALPAQARFENIRILVVTENRTAGRVTGEYIRELGGIPILAHDTGTALDLLAGHTAAGQAVFLVLADSRMTGMSGADLSRAIQGLTQTDPVPVVMLLAAGEQAAVTDPGICLSKPLRLADLREAILAVMENRPLKLTREDGASQVAGTAPPAQKHVRILVAEDYPANQQIVSRHLSENGYTVRLAEDGQQALAFFQREAFDLVLMDIQMPVMDGYEATRLIREAEKGGSRIPIVAMTAHAVQGYREKCLEAGMDDYITKPLKRRELIGMVEKWLGKDAGAAEPVALESDPPGDGDGPVDMVQVMSEFENDRNFYTQVFRVFMGSMEERLAVIETAARDKDLDTIRKQVHTIKGGAANIGAMPLFRVAQAIESKIGENVPETDLAELRFEFSRLKAFGSTL